MVTTKQVVARRGTTTMSVFPGNVADRILTLSLFSGAGGLDIGFHKAGYEIVAAVEIEKAYAETLELNTGSGELFGPGLKVHCEDIRTFDPSPYASIGIECVIGGPPCQTFSAAGRRSGGVLGLDDERGQLFKAYIRILKAIEPKVFVFENVYGLPGANGGGPWREIVKGFADAGYDLTAEVLDAADYGVPQHRERLFMVGARNPGFVFPLPTHGPDAPGRRPLVTAKRALKGLGDPKEAPGNGPGGLYGHLLPLVPEGMNYSFFTREMGHPAPQFAWRSKFHDFLYKADPESPVRTIKSKPGKFTGPFHWNNRHFTAAELQRLQSFPDDYKIAGKYNTILEQIGNSVPPGLAHAVATSVRDQLLRPTIDAELNLRPEGFESTFRKRQRERNKHFHDLARRAVAALTADEISASTGKPVSEEEYLVGFNGKFDRSFGLIEDEKQSYRTKYAVNTSRSKDLLTLKVATLKSSIRSSTKPNVRICITGLSKYMDHTDRVVVLASIPKLEELIHVWAIVEYELVRQSRFFSLIDIYGHYANRGDTVVVETQIDESLGELARIVGYFGNSVNCGVPLPLQSASVAMQTPVSLMPNRVDELRGLRFDVRTKATHPTLAPGTVLCTYPFPALSAKAHFEKGLTADPLAAQLLAGEGIAG